MNDQTRRNVERQIQLNKAKGITPEAHLRVSVVNRAYGSWGNLLSKHSNIIANDIQKICPNGVKIVVDNDLDK